MHIGHQMAARLFSFSATKNISAGAFVLSISTKLRGTPKGSPRVLYPSPVDRGGGWSIRDVEWSPDGSQIAAVLQTSGWDHIYSIPAAGGAPKQITDGAFVDEFPRFSPDGKSLAFISSRGGVLEATNLWTVPVSGGEAHQVAKFDVPGVTTVPEWTPDNKRLFFHYANPHESA